MNKHQCGKVKKFHDFCPRDTRFSPLVQGGKYVVQKKETKEINKLCVREILSLSFVCGACFFEFRGRNLVCFGIA